MGKLTCGIALGAFISASPSMAEERLPPGIWTNTEDSYFAEEEGREKPDGWGFEVRGDGTWRVITAFGQAQSEWRTMPINGLARGADGDGNVIWTIKGSELRKARPFTCWVSVKKFAAKPDGSADWTFANDLPMFDQGGRVLVPGSGEAPDVTIRMRNVTWAKGSRNRPSLVLYVHKDDPDRAESYSWASPDASLVGINLRWMQGSCRRMEEE
ncbi:hypothetical protein [Erythrobacter ani]|uniref:Uncharacterized protein n=1 Tax=Erythrobacter ani TaxID=2827235 RepID=A0ABS6SJQ6_9SPHN|nr:hypothetical protein [Erythrobacter ani]MBV7265197.1 hypothetical protein [Erythrobacter ani]